MQLQLKQLTTEKEAALRDAKRLTSELENSKASYDGIRAQLNGAIKKHYGPCPPRSRVIENRFIHPDGSSECRPSGFIRVEQPLEAPLLVPEPQPLLRPQFKQLTPAAE
jgi:hypothetical protein